MTLKELHPQLLALYWQEKAQAIQILAASPSLSNGYVGIEKTLGVMGGDACIRHSNSRVLMPAH